MNLGSGGKSLLSNVFRLGKMIKRNKQIKYKHFTPPAPFTIRPNQLDIGMTGSVYDTQVKRRRVIQDPNKPVLSISPVESLKWVNWMMLRDLRRRYRYSYHYPLRNNLTCMFRNDILPTTIREIAWSEACHLSPSTRIRGVTWRCIISSRGRGKYLRFRMARMAFRMLADYNLVSGAMKGIW